MKVKYKWMIMIVFIAIIASVVVMWNFHNKIVDYIEKLPEKLSFELDSIVNAEDISLQRHGLFLKINIKDFTLRDPESKTTIFMVDHVFGNIDFLRSILSFDIIMKEIVLENPRITLRWDDKTKKIIILGVRKKISSGEVSAATIGKVLSRQKKIIVKGGDLHLLNISGANLPLMNVNLVFTSSFEKKHELRLTSNIASAQSSQINFNIKTVGSIKDFTNSDSKFDVTVNDISLESIKNFFPEYKKLDVYGFFKKLKIQGEWRNTFHNLSVEYLLDNLKINNKLSLLDADGNMQFIPGAEKFDIYNSRLRVSDTTWFDHTFDINDLSARFSYEQSNNINLIKSDDLTFKVVGMEVSSQLILHEQNNRITSIYLNSNFKKSNIRKVKKILPNTLIPEKVIFWLDKSLSDGYITQSELIINDKQKVWHADFYDISLNYHNDWPGIDSFDAKLSLTPEQIYITAQNTKLFDNNLKNVKATLTHSNGLKYNWLNINGEVYGSLDSALEFLQSSKLKSSVADKLAHFQPSGNMDLKLNLDMMLAPSFSIITNGEMKILNGKVKLSELKTTADNISGNIKFSDKMISSTDLSLDIFEKPASGLIELDSNMATGLQVKINAELDPKSLHQVIPETYLEYIDGVTPVDIIFELPWYKYNNVTKLVISTVLKGININLPEPLHKTAEQEWATELKYFIRNDNERNLYLSINNSIDANFLLKNKKLTGGHISLGSEHRASLASVGRLLISGKLSNIDLDKWKNLSSNNPSFVPTEYDLLIEDLKINGNNLYNIWVKYDSTTHNLMLDSDSISGNILLPIDEDKIEFNLSKMNVDKLRSREYKSDKYPIVKFHCDELIVKEKKYNNINSYLLPRSYGYEIAEISLENQDIMLNAQGIWQMHNGEHTQISGSAYSNNFGRLLEGLGFGGTIKKGEGEINYSLRWNGSPLKFDLLSASGQSELLLKSGTILGVNPGLGKIVGLVSIESIQRRLQLDFSDLTDKGFAFDKLQSEIELEPGKISTTNTSISGPAARIDLAGTATLYDRQLDFLMNISPKAGPAFPVAVAIAASNPAVGAAFWLLDQASSGGKTTDISRYRYKVTGAWDAPRIEEIEQTKQ